MEYLHLVILIIAAGAGALVLLLDACDSFFNSYGDDYPQKDYDERERHDQ